VTAELDRWLAPIAAATAAVQERLEAERVVERIWQRDHTVWPGGPQEVSDRLGWLDVAAAYSCNDLAQSCASGGGGRSYCVDLGGPGDTCRQNDSCLSALYCEGFTPFVSEGTCQPRLALGDECDDGRECASTVCDEVCVPLGVEELYCALPDAL